MIIYEIFGDMRAIRFMRFMNHVWATIRWIREIYLDIMIPWAMIIFVRVIRYNEIHKI